MKVRWTATAVARLHEIEDFIAEDSPAAAQRFIDALIDEADGLVDAPARGRHVPELPGANLREIIFRGYRVIYRVAGRRIEILTIFEGHRLLRDDELGGA